MTPSARRTLWTAFLLFPLLPLVAQAAGPVPNLPWLHEGLLLNYTWISATVPNVGCFEDKLGHWHGADGSFITGIGSAAGIQQVTMAYVDPQKVVIAMQGFGNVPNADPLIVPGPQGYDTPASFDLSLWCDPVKLAALQPDPVNKLTVERTTWTAQNKTIDVVRVTDQSNGYLASVYDLKTGICVHYALDKPGPSGAQLTQGDFVSSRNLNIPWANDPTPRWLATVKVLHYDAYTQSMMLAGAPPINFKIDLTFTQAGDGWLKFGQAQTMPMMNGQLGPASPSVYGRAQFSGVWIGPASLPNLQQGQTLDTDPLTAITTTVSQVTGNSITISQVNGSGEMDCTYDKSSGLRTGVVYIDRVSGTRTVNQYSGQE